MTIEKLQEETAQAILEKIEIAHQTLLKGRATALEISLELGGLFSVLKPIVKMRGENFEDYVEREVPYITLRTIQNYMGIAAKVDPITYPTLKGIYFESIKWYGSSDDQIRELEEFLEELPDEDYGLIDIGEEISDVRLDGCPYDYGLRFTRKIEIEHKN